MFRISLVLALCLFQLGCASQDGTYFLAGPMPYRSMTPLSLIFPHPNPEPAKPLEAGRIEGELNTQYASIMVRDNNNTESIQVDGEFLRTSIKTRFGLGHGLECGVELPYLHYSSGFLDDFIEEFHDFLGSAGGKREKNPDDQFQAEYRNRHGAFLNAREDGIHLGDIPLYLKAGLIQREGVGWGLSIRGLAELPTGSSHRGFGSGRLDTGVGLLFEKMFSPSLICYFSADEIFRRDPSSFKGVRCAHVTHLSGSVEKALNESLSLVLQSDFQTRPLKDARLKEFTDPEWSATLGCHVKLSPSMGLKAYFAEGITTDSAPDFTMGLSLRLWF